MQTWLTRIFRWFYLFWEISLVLFLVRSLGGKKVLSILWREEGTLTECVLLPQTQEWQGPQCLRPTGSAEPSLGPTPWIYGISLWTMLRCLLAVWAKLIIEASSSWMTVMTATWGCSPPEPSCWDWQEGGTGDDITPSSEVLGCCIVASAFPSEYTQPT